MSNRSKRYTAEFRHQMVQLVRTGREIVEFDQQGRSFRHPARTAARAEAAPLTAL